MLTLRATLPLALFALAVTGCGAAPPPATAEAVVHLETPVVVPVAATAAATAIAAPDAPATTEPEPGPADDKVSVMSDEWNRERAEKLLEMLGALSAAGASSAGVLTGQSVLSGATASSGGLQLGGSGGGLVSAGGGGGLAGVGSGSSTSPPTVKGPVGSVMIGGISVSGGAVANARPVVAGMAAGFRRCYNRGLQNNPTMSGSVTLEAAIGPNGEVISVRPKSAKGLDAAVLACVQARIASAQFAPPDTGSAKVAIPVTFTFVAP